MSDVIELAGNLRSIAAVDYGTRGDIVFDAARIVENQGAAIERVLALHSRQTVPFEDYAVCAECSGQTWPCSTILAMEPYLPAVSDPQRRNGE
ncbi:hypothetical protein [Microbacterium sp. NPDC087592]|uniref:hypothetical protein n=1 Tax=Microbacterium sp. NPDC087592 TaxID=3364193 RepID=UPI0037F16B41